MSHHDQPHPCHEHDHALDMTHSAHEAAHVHEHTHTHTHVHEHTQDHAHPHTHTHETETGNGMDLTDIRGKIEKLLAHWLKHNTDHAENYTVWSERARKAGMPDIADRIDEIAALTRAIDEKIIAAQRLMVSGSR
jgi:exonuclease III